MTKKYFFKVYDYPKYSAVIAARLVESADKS